MEIDSYRRTRTIAEAQAQGYSHLRATCPSCGRIADVPWPLLIDRKGTNRNTFLGNIPLKCQRRDTTPTIRVSHSSNALVICDYYRSSRYTSLSFVCGSFSVASSSASNLRIMSCGAVNQGIRFLAHLPRGRGANRLCGSFVVAADLHAGECK